MNQKYLDIRICMNNVHKVKTHSAHVWPEPSLSIISEQLICVCSYEKKNIFRNIIYVLKYIFRKVDETGGGGSSSSVGVRSRETSGLCTTASRVAF